MRASASIVPHSVRLDDDSSADHMSVAVIVLQQDDDIDLESFPRQKDRVIAERHAVLADQPLDRTNGRCDDAGGGRLLLTPGAVMRVRPELEVRPDLLVPTALFCLIL